MWERFDACVVGGATPRLMASLTDTPERDWIRKRPTIPQQGEGATTCGLFVMQYAVCVANGVKPDAFTAADIPNIYMAVAETIAIRRNELEYVLMKVRKSGATRRIGSSMVSTKGRILPCFAEPWAEFLFAKKLDELFTNFTSSANPPLGLGVVELHQSGYSEKN